MPNFPFVWSAPVRTRAEWDDEIQRDAEWRQVTAQMDAAIASSPVPRTFTAWCCVCGDVRPMRVSWEAAVISADGTVDPDWSATPTCHGCGSDSALRALVRFVRDHRGGDEPVEVARLADAARAEQLARAFGTVGCPSASGRGATSWFVECGDMAHGDDPAALVDRWGDVVRGGGRLVVAAPFDAGLESSHAVHHGAGGPRLRLGWGLFEALRGAGFAEVAAHRAWSPWHGHIGDPVVIEAVK